MDIYTVNINVTEKLSGISRKKYFFQYFEKYYILYNNMGIKYLGKKALSYFLILKNIRICKKARRQFLKENHKNFIFAFVS